jgi:serine/threonine protein phosphatase PrpC
VWDVVEDQTAVTVVRQALQTFANNDASKAALALRDWAYLNGSGDNISVVVAIIEGP